MDCKEARLMTHAYADGELDVLTTARIESHVKNCAGCKQRLGELSALRASFKKALPYFKTPEGLQNRIQAGLRKSEKKPRPLASSYRLWARMGAVMAAVIVLSASLLVVMKAPSTNDDVAHEVISSHVRSLMAEHLTDIRSTDQHTVKPWFTGRLDFSPPVRDFASEGFALAGGRLDYLDNRQAAALVYQCRNHVINLFVWSDDREQSQSVSAHGSQGYHAYAWGQAGMRFWVVSDLNESDLSQFVRLMRTVQGG